MGYTTGELRAMDFVQLGNLMVFTAESFPPFYIRKEEDDRGNTIFVYYRNAIDMIVNGDRDNENLSFHKAIRTLPASMAPSSGYYLPHLSHTEICFQAG